MTLMNNHPDKNFAERVLERIESERVIPRPRWEFVFKNYFFWTLGSFSVALGSFAVAAMLFEITNVNWSPSGMSSGFFASLLDAMPFFWAAVLILFILVGYLNVRRTNRGYRYPLTVIAIGAMMTSLTLGVGLYAIGFGRSIEETVDRHTPFHRPILRHILDFHGSENHSPLYTGTSTGTPFAR